MMSPAPTDANAAPAPVAAPVKQHDSFLVFLLKLAVFVFVLRSFLFAPFSIPSESMLPRLLVGDYLIVTKWNYGYSRHSFPWSLPLLPGPGRLFERLPVRGDVVVFKAPPGNDVDYIKRVIGLPGDTVQVRDGVVLLNGVAIPKARIADFVEPVSPNSHCLDDQFARADAAVGPEGVCAYPRYRETLPGGRSYDVLDLGTTTADDTPVFTVPAGHLFMMGDDRDRSADSRFATDAGGIGFVPVENLVGKATVSVFSTDGRASWNPVTWFTAARWHRIGQGF